MYLKHSTYNITTMEFLNTQETDMFNKYNEEYPSTFLKHKIPVVLVYKNEPLFRVNEHSTSDHR